VIAGLALVAALLAAAPFLLYPAALWLHALLRPRPVRAADVTPSVSLVICAHDEEEAIEARLRNALALDYPPEQLSIWLASDGSGDRTVERARALGAPRVHVLDLPRQGKAAALAAAVQASDGEILAFSDANSEWAPDALRRLVRPFADPEVGGVAGDQRYRGASGGQAAGERGYWSFDRAQKRWQSRAGSAISATGAIYAVRRELFEAPPADATDDFMVSTAVVAAGRRLVFAADAIAWEPPAETASGEFRRKVRILTRGLRAVWYRRALLDPRRSGVYGLELLLHKLWRRLTWLPALLLLGLAPACWQAGGLAAGLAAAVGMLAALAALAGLVPALRDRLPFSVAAYVVMVQAACALATANFLLGRRYERWEPARAAEGPAT